MIARSFRSQNLWRLAGIVPLLLVHVLLGQDQPPLLRLQRSRATVDTEATGGMRGQGGNIMSLGPSASLMGTSTYPNTASCIVVYNDGRYFLEKRDEHNVGKPKVKIAEGNLAADDLQQLKSILENEEMKKVTALKAPEAPPNTQALREAELMEVQIAHADAVQHFVAMKERFKTASIGTSEVSAAPSSGLDTYVDNATNYRKTLSPLVKWFEGVEKKSKSSLKDSKPQYCSAMTF